MSKTIFQHLNLISRGVCLAALLTSAGAIAETPATAADQATGPQGDAQVADGQAAASDATAAPQRSYEAAAGRTRPSQTKRVYLEDYERIHKRVNRQYPTETYWVGKYTRSN